VARQSEGQEEGQKNTPTMPGTARSRFIVCDTVTLADFSIGSALNMSQNGRLPVDSYSNIASWYGRLTDLPGWRKCMVVPPANLLPAAQAVA